MAVLCTYSGSSVIAEATASGLNEEPFTMETADALEVAKHPDSELELLLPTVLLKKCLELPLGHGVEYPAHGKSGSKIQLRVQKMLLSGIKMILTGVDSPVMERTESTWQCQVCAIGCPDEAPDMEHSVPRPRRNQGGKSIPVSRYATRSKKTKPTSPNHILSQQAVGKQSAIQPVTTQQHEVTSETARAKTAQPMAIQPLSEPSNSEPIKRKRGRPCTKKQNRETAQSGALPPCWQVKQETLDEVVPEEKQEAKRVGLEDEGAKASGNVDTNESLNWQKLEQGDSTAEPHPQAQMSMMEVQSPTSEETKCQLCGKGFQRKAALRVHMLSSHQMTLKEYSVTQPKDGHELVAHDLLKEPPRLACKICGRTGFRNKCSFRNHLRTHKISVGDYIGAHGGENVKTANSICKETQQGAEKSKCMLCAREFANMNSLQNHMRGHRLGWYKYLELLEEGTLDKYLDANLDIIINPDDKKSTKSKRDKSTHLGRPTSESRQQNSIFCPVCKKSYKRLDSLRSHLRKYHTKAENRPDVIEVMEEYRRKHAASISSVVVSCPACNVQFNGQRVLKHLETVHWDHPEFEELHASAKLMFQKQKQAEDMKAPSWTTYKTCKLCGKQMRQRFLRVHQKYRCAKNPQRPKRYRCNRCSYTTTRQEDLLKHAKKHEPGNVYVCHQCGKAYKNNSSLVLHERSVHKMIRKVPPKQLTCEHCGKTFMYKFRYNMHIVSHIEVGTFQCDTCGKMFKTNQDVTRHKKTQHLRIYRYHCEKCGHGMEKKSYLESHKCGRVRRKEGTAQSDSKVTNATSGGNRTSDTAPGSNKTPVVHEPEAKEVVLTDTMPVQYEIVMPNTWNISGERANSAIAQNQETGMEIKYVESSQMVIPETSVLQPYGDMNWGDPATDQTVVIHKVTGDSETQYVQLEPGVYASGAAETLVAMPSATVSNQMVSSQVQVQDKQELHLGSGQVLVMTSLAETSQVISGPGYCSQ